MKQRVIEANENMIPSKEEMNFSNFRWRGIPVKYNPKMNNEGRNWTTYIEVGDKFFELPYNHQIHILDHEVAHNIADELIDEAVSDWSNTVAIFVQKKDVPKDSDAYRHGQRIYYEGLYGDIGATSFSETVTRAITEYFDDPNRLKQRSQKAFDYIENFINTHGNSYGFRG